MWFAPSDILFGEWFRFIDQLILDPEQVQPTQMRVYLFWLHVSLLPQFPQQNWLSRLKEYIPRKYRKNIIWWVIWCFRVEMFSPNFFSFFKSWVFCISVFIDLQSGLKIFFFHFLQISDVFNLWKLVLGKFFMVFWSGHLLNCLDPFRIQNRFSMAGISRVKYKQYVQKHERNC